MLFRIKILFILLFFIQSRIAHGVNIHFCGNLVADFSYLHDAEGCDMHSPKSVKDHHISKKTCCHDKVIIYDKNQLETESKTTSLFNTVISQSFYENIFIVDRYILPKIPESNTNKIPFFKENCSLVFYG
jgi:hypothetical protein